MPISATDSPCDLGQVAWLQGGGSKLPRPRLPRLGEVLWALQLKKPPASAKLALAHILLMSLACTGIASLNRGAGGCSHGFSGWEGIMLMGPWGLVHFDKPLTRSSLAKMLPKHPLLTLLDSRGSPQSQAGVHSPGPHH